MERRPGRDASRHAEAPATIAQEAQPAKVCRDA